MMMMMMFVVVKIMIGTMRIIAILMMTSNNKTTSNSHWQSCDNVPRCASDAGIVSLVGVVWFEHRNEAEDERGRGVPSPLLCSPAKEGDVAARFQSSGAEEEEEMCIICTICSLLIMELSHSLFFLPQTAHNAKSPPKTLPHPQPWTNEPEIKVKLLGWGNKWISDPWKDYSKLTSLILFQSLIPAEWTTCTFYERMFGVFFRAIKHWPIMCFK